MKAYRALDRFREGVPFRPWLLRIVGNTARNRRRSTRRQLGLRLRAEAAAPIGASAPSPEADLLREERRRELLDAINGLSADDRLVIGARYFLDSRRPRPRPRRHRTGHRESRLSRARRRLATPSAVARRGSMTDRLEAALVDLRARSSFRRPRTFVSPSSLVEPRGAVARAAASARGLAPHRPPVAGDGCRSPRPGGARAAADNCPEPATAIGPGATRSAPGWRSAPRFPLTRSRTWRRARSGPRRGLRHRRRGDHLAGLCRQRGAAELDGPASASWSRRSRARSTVEQVEKLVVEVGAGLTAVSVDGAPGYWITGPPHLLRYLGPDGDATRGGDAPGGRHARLGERWHALRIESGLGLVETLRIAESIGS